MPSSEWLFALFCVCFRLLQTWRRKRGGMLRTQQREMMSPTSWKRRESAYNNRCFVSKTFASARNWMTDWIFYNMSWVIDRKQNVFQLMTVSWWHETVFACSWNLSGVRSAAWKRSRDGLLSSLKKNGLSTSSSPVLWPKSASGRVPGLWRRVTAWRSWTANLTRS